MWDPASSEKCASGSSAWGLIPLLSEPPLTLRASQPIFALPLNQDPDLLPPHTQSHKAHAVGSSCALYTFL